MATSDDILKKQAEGAVVEQPRTTDRDRLGDFLAGLGGGIQGGNAAQIVAQRQNARANEFAQNQAAVQKQQATQLGAAEKLEAKEQIRQMKDPNSELSRSLQGQVFERFTKAKSILGLEGLEDEEVRSLINSQSGDELSKQDTVQFLAAARERQIKKKRQQERDAAAARKEALEERKVAVSEGKLELDKKKLDLSEAKKAQPDKKAAQAVTEIQDRYNNIKKSINDLQGLIEEDGTFDLVGPQNAKLSQRIDLIATDMAKLTDPDSVARASEVEAMRKLLFEPGITTRNSTAIETLKSFEEIVNARLENAFQVRGIEMPDEVRQQVSTLAADKPADVDPRKRLEEIRARRKELQEKMGKNL